LLQEVRLSKCREVQMNRVYLSFLGLGSDKGDGKKSYTSASYELNGIKSIKTEFVQVAEFDILIKQKGDKLFDKMIIVTTSKSYESNFLKLKEQLEDLGAINIVPVIISEDMSGEGQWKWFEEILGYIGHGDRITVDLTHGYRAVPIVFSTAINFLQKARNVFIDGVFYGAFDKDRYLTPIVDMKEFYLINEWAEAVSRLVEDADARKIAQLAKQTPGFQIGELNDKRLIEAIEDLTNTIRNVDIHKVKTKAETTLRLVREKEAEASLPGKLLLQLIIEKFKSLLSPYSETGKYDWEYFKTQLEIIRLLLEHKLYMQAYTAMREFIGSLCLISMDKARISNAVGKRCRNQYAEVFVNMFKFGEDKWKFEGTRASAQAKLMPFYQSLKENGGESILRDFTAELIDLRNGFDHAWTIQSGAEENVAAKGIIFLSKLELVIEIMHQKALL
jgi:CRISPR-associated Csx2 family protein